MKKILLLVALGLIGSASAATLSYTNFIDSSFGSGFILSDSVTTPYVGTMVFSYDADSALSDGSYSWDSFTNLKFTATFDGYGSLSEQNLLQNSSTIYIQLVGSSFLFTSSSDGNSPNLGMSSMSEGAADFRNGNLFLTTLLLNKDDLSGMGGQFQATDNSLYQFSANVQSGSFTYRGNYGKPADGVYSYPSPTPSPTPIGGGGGGAIPEPSTYALFGIGAMGLLMVLRRKKTA